MTLAIPTPASLSHGAGQRAGREPNASGLAIMRPFFSYYGAKWTVAGRLGPPRRGIVIEPFAGSACYSTRWAAPNVALYDVSEDVCDLWDWLINCSDADVAAIPDVFHDYEQVAALPRGPRLLVSFWISKGRAEASGALSPWYLAYRSSTNCRVWGAAVKARIRAQKPAIEQWTVDCMSYTAIPTDGEAHWHVDPPYNNAAGRRYPHSEIDYVHLAGWLRALPGTVDVCENVGADWLPFNSFCSVVTSRGRRSGAVSAEALCRLERVA